MKKSKQAGRGLKVVLCTIAIMAVVGSMPVDGRTVSSLIPVADTNVHEHAQSSATDGTNWLVAIKSSNEACAQLMSPDGVKIGSLIQTGRSIQAPSSSDELSAPFVAFGGGKYLMVWADESGNDTYGQFISTAGTLIDNAFLVAFDPGPDFVCDVASDGTDFFVTWEIFGDVKGRFVSSGGVPGTQVTIAEAADSDDDCESAAIVYGGGQYLVAWMEGRDGNYYPKCRQVSPSGTLGSTRTLGSKSYYYHAMNVAYGGDRFMVAWSRNASSSADNNLKGRMVRANGTLVGSGELDLVSGALNEMAVGHCLAHDGDYFLLVWTASDFAHGSTDDISYGQYADSDGNMLGSPFAIDSTPDAGGAFDFITGLSAFQGKALTLIPTDAMGSNGDVYAVLIDSQPWSELQMLSSGDMQIEFNGILESNTNLVSGSWTELSPQPATPWSFSPTESNLFFRALRVEE